MLEVIPSVNRKTWQEVESDIKKVAPVTDWIEIDIGDGKLTQQETWNNPDDLKTLTSEKAVRFAVHLMVLSPEKEIERWIKAGVRRIIVQWEAVRPHGFGALFNLNETKKRIVHMAEICRYNWVEFGISLAIPYRVSAIKRFLPMVDLVQILAGTPGPSHQKFNEQSLERARELVEVRNQSGFQFKTEWDVGVNPETIEAIKKTKVDIVASTSFVFNSANPIQALEYLRKKARGLI